MIRIKRKNQNLRIKQRHANKKLSTSLSTKIRNGDIVINRTVPEYPKHIWPNQAQP